MPKISLLILRIHRCLMITFGLSMRPQLDDFIIPSELNSFIKAINGSLFNISKSPKIVRGLIIRSFYDFIYLIKFDPTDADRNESQRNSHGIQN